MYNRENIDPRHLGLYRHHKSVRMLKTHQWYQSLGLFSIILDATCFQSLEKSIFSFLESELVESTDRLVESTLNTNQLTKSVHALDELVLQNAEFRVLKLELD